MSHYYYTEEGFQKAKKELEELERYIKVDIAKALGTAAAHGDLRENAEYAAAKENQANSMAKMNQMRQRITRARIVTQEDFPNDTVTLCKRVKIKDVSSSEEIVYTILGEGESDIENGIISYQSPLAAGLIGSKVGEVASVELPGGNREYEILELEFYAG